MKGRHQAAKPSWRGDGIVIEKGDDIGVAFRQSAVSRAAKAGNRLEYILGRIFPGGSLSLLVTRGVVDDQYVVRCRLEPGNGRQALLQKRGAVARTDGYGDGQGAFLTAWN